MRRAGPGRTVPWLVGILAAALTLGAVAAQAHTRSISYSSWMLDETGARVRLRATLLDLSRKGLAPAGAADVAGSIDYLVPRVSLRRGGVPCSAGPVAAHAAPPEGWVWLDWRVECGASGPLALESRLFLDVAPGHLHFARIVSSDGVIRERVLDDSAPRWVLAGGPAGAGGGEGVRGTSLAGYLGLGVEHILSGWDHLVFVLALLLLAGSLGEVARLVTGFTIAHSVTLGLAVLGVLRPDGAAVEALIGYSIALVAAENAWLVAARGSTAGWTLPAVVASSLLGMALLSVAGAGTVSALTLVGAAVFSACHFALLGSVSRPARLRVAVAFAFGLVHGFGFAGVLAEMTLPAERLVPALFGFNLGVEIGQLGVVALVWPGLRWLERHRSQTHQWIAEVGSAAICGLGVFWFVMRSYGV